RGVGGVEDRRAEPSAHRLVDPLGGEAVRAERLVLDCERVTLLVVRGQTETAGPPAGVAGEGGEPLERPLRHAPVAGRLLAADRLDRHVVRRGAAAKREPAVPPARAAGDLPRLVEADL